MDVPLFTAIVIAFIIVITIIVFFTISIVKQQKRSLQLQKGHALAEISAMERERSRIAADLHDDVGPMLSMIKFQIFSVDTASEEDMQGLNKVNEHIDDIISRLREISVNLMPASLLRKGLGTAIEEYMENLQKSGIVRTHFHSEMIGNHPQDTSINLFRICQEVVHNALKHAEAKNISIRIKEEKGMLSLLVKDDGKGFDYEKRLKDSSGFGLRSIKNRAELLNGEMIVESKPGVGSAFLFEIPVEG
jgi:signal transduction histidine kinase